MGDKPLSKTLVVQNWLFSLFFDNVIIIGYIDLVSIYPGSKVYGANMGSPGGRLNKKDGLTRYGDSHVKDKTS